MAIRGVNNLSNERIVKDFSLARIAVDNRRDSKQQKPAPRAVQGESIHQEAFDDHFFGLSQSAVPAVGHLKSQRLDYRRTMVILISHHPPFSCN